MKITLFRRLEFWFVLLIFGIILGQTLYENYTEVAGILRRIEPAEQRRIALLYNWKINGLIPLLVLAFSVFGAWLCLTRLILPLSMQPPMRTKALLYVGSIVAVIFGAVVYYLAYLKDLDFRYVVDWCSENGHDWVERSVMGAKVRSPFRWLNVLFLTADILLKLGLYAVISFAYQWAIQQPEGEEESVNVKIVKEGSLLALAVLAVMIMVQLPHFHLFEDQFLFAFAACGHAYLFHKNLVRRPEPADRKQFRQEWLVFMGYALLAALVLRVLLYTSSFAYLYRYVTDYYNGFTMYQRRLFRVENVVFNFTFIILLSGATVLVRMLAVRPWQIRFRSKQAELAGLQSQVNPHFLFNALNTLYASAIGENAERTSGGIQKLSDMMRFMLHENNKEKIDIRQEVNYLKNYIDLQQLRAGGIKDFELKTDLDDTLCLQSIAPMLLVPFVENAFKHGLSMRHPSWIDIKLRCDGKQLYFSVFNSLHPKSEEDPERNASGVGLENVKKRLLLLYPKKHQLTIHQTEREFSIMLTLNIK